VGALPLPASATSGNYQLTSRNHPQLCPTDQRKRGARILFGSATAADRANLILTSLTGAENWAILRSVEKRGTMRELLFAAMSCQQKEDDGARNCRTSNATGDEECLCRNVCCKIEARKKSRTKEKKKRKFNRYEPRGRRAPATSAKTSGRARSTLYRILAPRSRRTRPRCSIPTNANARYRFSTSPRTGTHKRCRFSYLPPWPQNVHRLHSGGQAKANILDNSEHFHVPLSETFDACATSASARSAGVVTRPGASLQQRLNQRQMQCAVPGGRSMIK